MDPARKLEPPTPHELRVEYAQGGSSYEELGKKYGRSSSWVHKQMNKAKESTGVKAETAIIELVVEALKPLDAEARTRVMDYVKGYLDDTGETA